ncbi:hypothetical protein NE235_12620 [Actinoallomurus spadix]|uniref:DUF5666 domain-containing protein n=1 Tax=Actinoallomurus spadix TaxID=79912 RepID=A0ABN0X6U4_9ACTN|nr:hypothetical protein [Actinoallomurus spadix]MCO5986946.1 hypothetical protein [Actinoallomurus spadix]
MPGTRRKGSDAPVDEVPPEELLRTSPFEGDLAEELAAAKPRRDRRLPSATMALAAGVLVVAGFVGGVQADKHWGKKQTTAGFPQFARNGQGGAGLPGAGGGRLGAFGGGAQGGTAARSGATGQGGAADQNGAAGQGGAGGQGGTAGQGGAGGGAGGGTTGTVKLVDGDVIYVQTADGIVRVKTTGATKVSVTKSAKVKDLKAGTSVVVQGTPGQDGGVTATTVTQRP